MKQLTKDYIKTCHAFQYPWKAFLCMNSKTLNARKDKVVMLKS